MDFVVKNNVEILGDPKFYGNVTFKKDVTFVHQSDALAASITKGLETTCEENSALFKLAFQAHEKFSQFPECKVLKDVVEVARTDSDAAVDLMNDVFEMERCKSLLNSMPLTPDENVYVQQVFHRADLMKSKDVVTLPSLDQDFTLTFRTKSTGPQIFKGDVIFNGNVEFKGIPEFHADMRLEGQLFVSKRDPSLVLDGHGTILESLPAYVKSRYNADNYYAANGDILTTHEIYEESDYEE